MSQWGSHTNGWFPSVKFSLLKCKHFLKIVITSDILKDLQCHRWVSEVSLKQDRKGRTNLPQFGLTFSISRESHIEPLPWLMSSVQRKRQNRLLFHSVQYKYHKCCVNSQGETAVTSQQGSDEVNLSSVPGSRWLGSATNLFHAFSLLHFLRQAQKVKESLNLFIGAFPF